MHSNTKFQRTAHLLPYYRRIFGNTGRINWLALLGAASVVVPGLSQAQSSNDATNSVDRLPVVTVTAQKEPANLQSLPISATAVTKDTIQDAGIRYVNDATGYVPNTYIAEFSARKLSSPRFRGVGAGPDNPGVTTYYDGVPMLSGLTSSLELIDVDQIEFVRGPQGALFGRNTVGGLINVTSARPSFTDRTVGGSLTYGNYNLWDVRASASSPIINDKLSLGVGLGYSGRDGYTVNDTTGHDLDSREALFGKFQLRWAPADHWELRVIVGGERARDGDYSLRDPGIDPRNYHVNRDVEGRTDRDVFSATFLAERTGEKVDFTSTTGIVSWQTFDLTDNDYSPFPFVTRFNKEKAFQFTEEVRFSSAKDAPITLNDQLSLKWQAGASVFTQNYDQNAYYDYLAFFPVFPPFFAGPGRATTIASRDDIGMGVYGQLTLTAWEKLDFTAGLRFDYEDKEATINTSSTQAGVLPTSLTASKDYNSLTPQASVSYRLTPSHMLYASFAQGYKAGGFSANAPAGRTAYDQEKSYNYEIGTKTTWFDDRLSVNLSAFYTHWEDIQVYVPPTFFIGNAGKAASKGLELEVHIRPTAGLDLFAGAGVMEAKFLGGAMSSGANVSGNDLQRAPEYTLNGGAQYVLPLCEKVSLFLRAETIVTGSTKFNDSNTQAQGSYVVTNFRGGLRGKNWSVEGWARNAFDERYNNIMFSSQFPLAPGNSGTLVEPGAPATFGVTASIRF